MNDLKRKVLVVDDDMLSLVITTVFLEKLGCSVVKANDGAEAFAKYREMKFDLVLTDIIMPDMTGYTLLEMLREAGCVAPIVVLSAMDRYPKEMKDEFDYKLVKPVSRKQFIEMFNNVMKIDNEKEI